MKPTQPTDILSLQEGISALVFLIGMFALAGYYYRNLLRGKAYRAFFLPAFAVKVAGGIAFVWIHLFWLIGDDTLTYFDAITLLSKAILRTPGNFFELMLAAPGDSILPNYIYFSELPSLTLVKLGTLVSLISGNSFWVITFGFGLISFWGVWALFVNLVRLYPGLQTQVSFLLFFIPSVMIWSSGLMKDSIALGFFCWLCYAVINLLFLHRKVIRSIWVILICTFLIANLRLYMAVAMIPALVLMVTHLAWQNLDKPAYKVLLIGAILLGLVVLEALTDGQTQPLASYHKWHIAEIMGRAAGSGYVLSPLHPGWIGFLKAFFPAVGTTFFRPFPWEWRSMTMAMMGIESVGVIIFCLWVLFTTRLKTMIQNVIANPLIGFFLLYSLTFGFAMGLFSYNFGTLARYRIAVLPFFLLAFLLLKAKDK
jgi:hypothetical protein